MLVHLVAPVDVGPTAAAARGGAAGDGVYSLHSKFMSSD